MKRLFLMKPMTYTNQNVDGWWLSEKLDGIRAFWDGGITTGLPASIVPFANDDRTATGLWTNLGKVINAPKWFVNGLPKIQLDGELWIGRSNFQQLVSTVRKYDPVDSEWDRVKYMVWDVPSVCGMFDPSIKEWVLEKRKKAGVSGYVYPAMLSDTYMYLKEVLQDHPYVSVVEQHIVSDWRVLYREFVDGSAEGIVLRSPSSCWEPYRSKRMVKIKKCHDMEVKVIGFYYGNGKHAGSMGSLLVTDGDRIFSVCGFTDIERVVKDSKLAEAHQGELAGKDNECLFFKNGDILTIEYMGLSDNGIPREPKYFRKREVD